MSNDVNIWELYAGNSEAQAILASVDNQVMNKIISEPVTFTTGINAMIKQGLSFALKDYYVFIQKGNVLAIQPTPKGTKKILSSMARSQGLSVIINEGVIHDGDEIEFSSDGRFDSFKITKNLMHCATSEKAIIKTSYAVVSVFRKKELVAKKVFYMPVNEYIKIKALAKGSANYEIMFASKVIIKRVLAGIYLLLGVSLDDGETMDMLEDANRVDNGAESEPHEDENNIEKINEEQVAHIKELIELNEVNELKFKNYLKASFKADSIADLSTQCFDDIITQLEKKGVK